MNYKKIYDNIIEKRTNQVPDGYKERHHIIPRSLGGTDAPENLVYLTAREHFICHYLLAKMYEKYTLEWYKTNHAFLCMKSGSLLNKRYFNSRLYEGLRKNFSEVMSKSSSKENNSQFGTRWVHNPELEKNKKIPKSEKISDGWLEGRRLNWKKTTCKYCSKNFLPKYPWKPSLYCSDTCKTKDLEENGIWKNREETLLILYEKHNKNLNKALKEMGFPGAVGGYYDNAMKILRKYHKL